MLGEARAGRARVEHGRDPAPGGRGRRAGDRQPGPGARFRRPRGLRADADPGPLGRAGRGRDGLLRDRPSRRPAGDRGQREALRAAVGLRGAGYPRPDRTRDAGRRARPRAGRPVLVGRELPRRPAGPGPGAGIARTDPAADPHGHRSLVADAGRPRRGRAAAAGGHAVRDPRRRHRDDDRAPGGAEPRDRGSANRRGEAGIAGPARPRGPGATRDRAGAGRVEHARSAPRDRGGGPRLRSDRRAERGRRLVPVRGPSALRGNAVRDRRRPGTFRAGPRSRAALGGRRG